MTLRPELSDLPARIRRLPLDARGYPVPWFVAWENGVPEFRAMDARKFADAIKYRQCWVCGEPMGVHLSFVIGPMCAINRTTSEPPCHHECAVWSARNCPFLTRPHMVRREAGLPEDVQHAAGLPILRNPGAVCVWTTRRFDVHRAVAGNAGPLLALGSPERVEWFAEGRPATRAEVEASIDSGLPALHEAADLERTAVRRVQAHAVSEREREAVARLFPAA
jgi:hypothetical protein